MTSDGYATPAIGLSFVNLAMRLAVDDSVSVTLAAASPRGHHLSGGSAVQISGINFYPGMRIEIAGVPVLDQSFIDPLHVSARVPALPPGVYDVTAEDIGSGALLDTLSQAIQIVDARLPPVQDVSAVHLRDHVSLRWSHVLYCDEVRLYRDLALIATFDGATVGFVDDLSAEAPDTAHDYRIVVGRDGIDSYPADVRAAPLPDDCWSSASPVNKLGLIGRLGANGLTRLTVYGGDSTEIKTAFTLSEALDGLRIRAHVARLESGGALKARIRTLTPPQNIVVDDIALSDLYPSAQSAWVDGVFPGPVPTGEYILGLYVDGGNPAEAVFAITADASEDDPEPPLPCPPYPLAFVKKLCGGLPPQIADIRAEVTRPVPDIWYRSEGYSFVAAVGLPLSNINERVITLTADAQDADGSIVDYRWNFVDEQVESMTQANSVCHTFADYGFYDVMLTVTDSSGLTTTATKTVSVMPYMKTEATTGVKIFTDSDGCYIPQIDVPVTLEVQAMAWPATNKTITGVTMQLINPDNGNVLWTEVAWSPVPGGWQAEFNMSQSNIPANADSVLLRVRAFDSAGGSGTEERTICLCPMPKFTGWNNVTTTVTHDNLSGEYRLESTFDPGLIGTLPITLFGRTLQNDVKAYLTSKLRLNGHQWIGDSLVGQLEYTVMGAKHVKSFDVLPDLKFLECPDFGITYEKTGLEIFNKKTDQVTIMDHEFLQCFGFEPWAVPIEFCFYATLKATFYAKLVLDLSVTLKDIAPNLIIDTTWTPEAGLDQAGSEARLDIDVHVAWLKIGSIWVAIYPQLGIQLPVQVGFSAPPPNLDIDLLGSCVRLDINGEVGLNAGWFGSWSTGSFDIYDQSWPNGCIASGPGAEGSSSITPKLPALATSPGGSTSMMVFVKETSRNSADPRPEIYFAVDKGFGWSVAGPAFAANEYPESNPHLAFVSDQTAVLVWSRNRLTQAQLDQLPGDVTGLNTRLASGEIYYALWTTVGGWGTPQLLTNDGVAQGMPQIAAVPGLNAAWVTWVGYDTADVFDANATAHPEQTSIYARALFNGVPVGSAVKVSTGDETSPAADFAPTIACDAQGRASLAWLRESADLTSRNLMYAWFNGTAWGAPTTSIGRPQYRGIDMPAVALSKDGNGSISFTALTGDEGNGVDLGVADRLVYAARFANQSLLAPEQLKAHKCGDDKPLLGSWPSVLSLGGERFAVGLRTFTDGRGVLGSDGEIGVSVADFNAGGTWSPVRELTTGDTLDYEVRVSYGQGDTLHTVRNTGEDDGSGNTLALEDFDLGADLAVQRVVLADPYTRPGADVTLSALLRNDGFRTATDVSATVQVGRVVDQTFELITELPVTFTAEPGEVQTVTTTVRCDEDTTTLRVRVIGLDDDVDQANNSADVVLGVLAPEDLDATPLKAGKHVALTWINADLYDAILIYRDGRLIDTTAGWSEAYVDDHANPGWHSWSIRGRLGASLSEPLGAVVQHRVGVKETFPRTRRMR